MRTRFKFLSGDVNTLAYGGKWISGKLSNGEFDYWLVIELLNMDEACGRDNEGQPRYCVTLSAVSPDQAGPDRLAIAFDCCGIPDEAKGNPLAQVEALDSYGIKVQLWTESGNNARKLLREARKQPVEMLFGFYMDKPLNRIGSTGWEFIKGDLNSGLARAIESGSQ